MVIMTGKEDTLIAGIQVIISVVTLICQCEARTTDALRGTGGLDGVPEMLQYVIITLGVILVILIVSLIGVSICHEIFKKHLRVLRKAAYVQENNSLPVLKGHNTNSPEPDEGNIYDSIDDMYATIEDNYESVADQTEVVAVIQASEQSALSCEEGLETVQCTDDLRIEVNCAYDNSNGNGHLNSVPYHEQNGPHPLAEYEEVRNIRSGDIEQEGIDDHYYVGETERLTAIANLQHTHQLVENVMQNVQSELESNDAYSVVIEDKQLTITESYQEILPALESNDMQNIHIDHEDVKLESNDAYSVVLEGKKQVTISEGCLEMMSALENEDIPNIQNEDIEQEGIDDHYYVGEIERLTAIANLQHTHQLVENVDTQTVQSEIIELKANDAYSFVIEENKQPTISESYQEVKPALESNDMQNIHIDHEDVELESSDAYSIVLEGKKQVTISESCQEMMPALENEDMPNIESEDIELESNNAYSIVLEGMKQVTISEGCQEKMPALENEDMPIIQSEDTELESHSTSSGNKPQLYTIQIPLQLCEEIAPLVEDYGDGFGHLPC